MDTVLFIDLQDMINYANIFITVHSLSKTIYGGGIESGEKEISL